MNDERWKSLLSFAQFILGTVVLGVVGTIINNQIQTREIEIKEQEQIAKNLGTVLSTNSADKLLMAQFYAAVTRSDDIRKRWEIYRDELKKEIDAAKSQREKTASEIQQTTDAKLIDQKQAIIQQIDAAVTPGAKAVSAEALPARIYFHIQNESQRENAGSIAKKIATDPNVVVPGIQRVEQAPIANEIRYFKLAEAVEAQGFSKSLQGLGIDATAKYIPGYESSQKLRPRHYELWLSSAWR
ncbi:MAG: hypothetical protein WCT30_05845 [Desulfurivibrionaceae bacterium]|jgi:hypothetical protein